jgi:hypothetical protein
LLGLAPEAVDLVKELGIDLLLRRRPLRFFIHGRELRRGRKRDQDGKQQV